MRRILISGAYGRAGSVLARKLTALDTSAELLLSGRNAEQLRRLVETLDGQTKTQPLVSSLDEPRQLVYQLSPGDIWINCAPWPDGLGEAIAEAIVAADITYLDIQPSPVKKPTFRDAFVRYPSSQSRVALEAGVSPGAPALVANFISQGLDWIQHLTLDVAMRDPAIPDAGLNDLLAHLSEPAMHWRKDRWYKASILSLRRKNPDEGFSGGAAPAWMPEIDEFARTRQPAALDCYYIAPSATSGLILAFGYLTRPASSAQGRNLLLPALRRAFANAGTPSGFALRGRVEGRQSGVDVSRECLLRFDDLYLATVSPVVAAIRWILDGGCPASSLACFGNQFPSAGLLVDLPDGRLSCEGDW